MPTAATMIQTEMGKVGRDPLGLYIANTYITALTTTTFTAPLFFLNGQYTNNTLLGWCVWRPGAATAADWVRHILSVTKDTGLVTVDVAWSDGTLGSEDIYLLPPGILPHMLINAAQNALKKAYFPNMEPLSIKPVGTGIADAGFQNTATSAYTTYGTTTFTKDSTTNSENVFRGISSGKIVNTAVTSGVLQQYAIDGGELVYVHNLSRLSSGTGAQLELYDGTSVIGTTVQHAQRKWQYMRRIETMTAGKTTLTVRHLGAGITDTVYFNGVFVMPAATRHMILDTRWDTAYKAEMGLAYVDFRGNSVSSDVFDAFSTELTDIPDHLFDIDIEKTGANPTQIQFHDGIEEYLQYPIYLKGRRAYADLYTVTLADITTNVPIDGDMWGGLFRAEFYLQGDVQRRIPDALDQLSRGIYDANQRSAQYPVEGAKQRVWSNYGRVSN